MIQWGKVWSDLFIILALTSNIGFFLVSNDPYQLVIALGVNLIATVLKFNIKKFLAAELLATAFISDLHLIPAAVLYFFSGSTSSLVTGLAVGAAVANLLSVILIVIDIIMSYVHSEEA